MPKGVPKYIRVYDNGGYDGVVKLGRRKIKRRQPGSIDHYTVVFTGHYQPRLWADGKTTEQRPGWGGGMETVRRPFRCLYLAMNGAPFHPQGFGQHGEHTEQVDTGKHGRAPGIGGSNHLGIRIRFQDLPEDCRKLVRGDYKELWDL
jgi:hypothetical protein